MLSVIILLQAIQIDRYCMITNGRGRFFFTIELKRLIIILYDTGKGVTIDRAEELKEYKSILNIAIE